MMVYMDGNFLNEICDVPQLSTEAWLFIHVFKRMNQLPEHHDKFSVWSARASVSALEMPPPVGTLCRSGQQFIGFTNPIMRYEAGVGTTPLAADAAEFTQVIMLTVLRSWTLLSLSPRWINFLWFNIKFTWVQIGFYFSFCRLTKHVFHVQMNVPNTALISHVQ